jgi:hypothetical protein
VVKDHLDWESAVQIDPARQLLGAVEAADRQSGATLDACAAGLPLTEATVRGQVLQTFALSGNVVL